MCPVNWNCTRETVCTCISSLVNESLQLILFIMHYTHFDFQRYVNVLFRSRCNFSNLSLRKCYFHKFYYLYDHVYFQLSWFLKREVAEAFKLQKMTVTFRHMFFTGLILVTGEIDFVFEFHENYNRPKTGCHGNSNCFDISRTVPQNRLFFH